MTSAVEVSHDRGGTATVPRLTILAECLQGLFLGEHKITDDRTSRVHPDPFRNDQVPDVALVCMNVNQSEVSWDLYANVDQLCLSPVIPRACAHR